jgi:ABC-type sugar transport system permease subunit
MSGTELYRRALVRFAISLILTIADGLICSIVLYNTFGNGVMFALVLLLMVPWAWTLSNIWRHTFSDLRRIQDTISMHEYDDGLATVDRNA